MIAGGYGVTLMPRIAAEVRASGRTGQTAAFHRSPTVPHRRPDLAAHLFRRADFSALGKLVNATLAIEELDLRGHTARTGT